MVKQKIKKLLACMMSVFVLATSIVPASAAETSMEAKMQECASNRQYFVYKLTKTMIDPKLQMNRTVVDGDYFDEKTKVALDGAFGFQDTVAAFFGSKSYETKYYRKIMAECIMPVGTEEQTLIDTSVLGLTQETLYDNFIEDMEKSDASEEAVKEVKFIKNVVGIGTTLMSDTSEAGLLLNKISCYTGAHLNALNLVRKNAGSKSSIGKAAQEVIDATDSTNFKKAFKNYMKFLGYELGESVGEAGLAALTGSASEWASAAFGVLAGDAYEEEMNELFYLNLQNKIFSTFCQLTDKYPNVLQSQYTTEEIQNLTNLTLLYLRCGQLGFAYKYPENAEACAAAYKELQRMEFPWIEVGGNAAALAGNISASDYNVPGTISTGDTYVIFGTINSDEMIHSVKAEVTGANGYICSTANNVNATQFDIATLDAQMQFNILAPGAYTYMVTATTSSGEHKVISSEFQVQAENGEMTIVGYRLPHTMNVGAVFAVKGTVYSRTPMTSISVEIRDMAGNYMTGGYESGSFTSYNLVNLDPYVEFNKVPAGRYQYIIKATNAYGEEVLVNQEYLVR